MHMRELCNCAALAAATAATSPAMATPLAPFALHAQGAVEIKMSGYLAHSADDAGGTGLREASFGAGYLTSINALGNPANQLWRSGQDNQSVSFMLYGVADANVLPVAGSSAHQVLGAGCTDTAFGCDGKIHLDFYLDRLSGGSNPGFGLGGIKAAQRQGFSTLGGITDGALLMRWEFVPGLTPSLGVGPSVTLFQQLAGLTSPSSGYGSYLANCSGGPACRYFGTGLQTGGADFYGTNTMTSILALSAIGQNGWSTRLSDPAIAQVMLDQPASSGLFVLAAATMVLVRRRRQRG